MEFLEFLALVRKTARQFQKDGLHLEDAYCQAVLRCFITTAEGQDVSPFEARLLAQIRRARRMNGGDPVTTTQIAVAMGMADPTVRYHLRKLKKRGLVYHPAGPRQGWGERISAAN